MASNAGIEVVLRGLPRAGYPMTKERVRAMVGELEVSDSMGERITVRELLDRVNEDRFDSPEDIARALEMGIALETERTVPD
jgi:hypothetical protein